MRQSLEVHVLHFLIDAPKIAGSTKSELQKILKLYSSLIQ